MKRSARIKKHANTQGFCAAVMFMMSLSAGTFAVAFYEHEEAFWMLVCAAITIAGSVFTCWHFSEYVRLEKLAYREAMEEIGLVLPREFKG